MRIGISSYSYEQYLSYGAMDLFDVIEGAAEAGYEGIEFANIVFPEEQDRFEYMRSLNRACREMELNICGYSIAGDFQNEDLAAEINSLKEQIDLAEALGTPTMRIDIMDTFRAPYLTLEKCCQRAADGIRTLAQYAEEKGIVLTTENHGRVFADSTALEVLVSRVGHKNFGLLADIGNFTDADEDCSKAVGSIAAFVHHVHIKDFHIKNGSELYPGEGWYVTRGGNYIRGAIVGHGNVPIIGALKALAQAGYDGWLVVEFEGIEDCKMAADLSLRNTRRMLNSLHLFNY